MDYIVLSTAVTDELHFADGTCMPHVAGGAGIYALAGMKLWRDDVGIVTGVGADYLDLYGGWYAKNDLPVEGLLVKDEHTPHNVIRYFANGERTETPRYGLEHYQRIEGTPADLARFCGGAKGVYVFKNLSQPFWEEIFARKEQHGFRLMWEIASDATIPENLAAVREIAEKCDVFSINRTEAQSLLGVDTLEAAIELLRGWNVPMVYLRVGKRGAYAIADGAATLVPSIDHGALVDVTGGGNSSSGGAFVGFCETGDAVIAARMGNISAAFCIEQYGVPERLGAAARADAAALMAQMEGQYEK